MAATEQQTTPAAEPKIEVTINTKPISSTETADDKIEPVKPKLDRKDSADSTSSDEDWFPNQRQPRSVRRAGRGRNWSPSPVRIIEHPPPPVPVTPVLYSSAQLLEKVDYDGITDMPYPGRSSIYLTTFPFTERDVKKWAWLFAHGVEDVFLEEHIPGEKADDEDDEDDWYGRGRGVRPCRNRRRDRSPYYNDFNNTVDIPSVYMSRALDASVVPEDTEKVRYCIVVQNRNKTTGGTKLLTAESRKAAGVLLYYEALNGNSVVFVGAIVGGAAKKAKKFRKVDSVEQAMAAKEEGAVGIIC